MCNVFFLLLFFFTKRRTITARILLVHIDENSIDNQVENKETIKIPHRTELLFTSTDFCRASWSKTLGAWRAFFSHAQEPAVLWGETTWVIAVEPLAQQSLSSVVTSASRSLSLTQFFGARICVPKRRKQRQKELWWRHKIISQCIHECTCVFKRLRYM